MDDAQRTMAREIAKKHLESGDAVGWFEDLYARANGDITVVPWAESKPNPYLVSWLAARVVQPVAAKALVVGCGLGDDAEELARCGFDTTAFDVSPTAISWCQTRFQNSRVHYIVADLFRPAPQWKDGFDLVLESYTLQAMPADLRQQAMPRIGEFVRPGGMLLIIARGREPWEPEGGIPWPLTRAELSVFCSYAFREKSFEEIPDVDEPGVRRFRIEYVKEDVT